MSKPYEISREVIQVAQGANLLAYKRDGLILNASPIQEYVRLQVSGIADNQSAVFDLNAYGLDLLPEHLLADFIANTGNITFTVNYYGSPVLTFSVNGNSAAAGVELPKIPISSENSTLVITASKACRFIWISAKQVTLLSKIDQDYFA